MYRTLTLIILTMMAVTATAEPDFSLDAHRGKVVLVDFWASWCVPCRRSFPWMNDMQAKYADEGLVIVAVNLDQDSGDAATFLENYPAGFAIHFDPDGSVAHDFQVEVMPSSFLIGRDGELIGRHAGFKAKDQDDYEAQIRLALFPEGKN